MTQTFVPRRSGLDAARRAAFRPAIILLATFLAISAAMVAVLAVLTATGAALDSATWIRCSLVFGSAIILLVFGVNAARGSRNAWVRLRIISPVVVVAVVVIVSIPGFLPDWVRLEQAVCGAIVLPVAILVNLPRVSALFAKQA
jgi:hypothetical protein